MNPSELKSVISKRERSLVDVFSKLDSVKVTETLENLELVWNEIPPKLGASLIVEDVIENIFKTEDATLRTILVDLGLSLITKFPLSLLSKEEITKFKATVKNIYINKLGDFRKNHDPLWHKIWVLLIRFLQKHLHHDTALANCMLRLIENAFRTPEDRIDSYNCWKELIDNYSLNEAYIAQPKHVKLLVIPLTATISKIDAVTVKRFEVWVYLIKAMKQNAIACFSQFLNFCFGPLRENPLLENDGTPAGPGKRCAVIYSDVAEFLMESLGHSGHCGKDCFLGNVKKYVLDKAVVDSSNFEKVDEDIFRSVCECCLLLQKWGYSSMRDKVMNCLWKSFISILENTNDTVIQKNVSRICWFLINLAEATTKKDSNFYVNLLTNINKTVACSKTILIPLLRELPKKTVSITGCKNAVAQLTQMASEHFGKFEFLKMSNEIFKSSYNPNDNCNVLGDIWVELANSASDLSKISKFLEEVKEFFEKDGLGFLLWPAANLHCVSTENKQKVLQTWTNMCKEISKNSKEFTYIIGKALTDVNKRNPSAATNVALMQNSLEDLQPVVKLEICNLEIKSPYSNLLQKSAVSPAKIKGSQLNSTSAKVQKKPANIVPSIFKSPATKTTKDDGSKFVIIDTEYKFDRSKLSEHQKEVLKKRRDDIPSLYQDLSQDTQSQSNSLHGDLKIRDRKEENQIETNSEAIAVLNKSTGVKDGNCVENKINNVKEDSEQSFKENNNLQENDVDKTNSVESKSRNSRGRPKKSKKFHFSRTENEKQKPEVLSVEAITADEKLKLKVQKELEKLRMDVRGGDHVFVEKRTRKSLQNNADFLYSPLKAKRSKLNKDAIDEKADNGNNEQKVETEKSVLKDEQKKDVETPKELQKIESPPPKKTKKNEDILKESSEKMVCTSPKREKIEKKVQKISPEVLTQTEEIIESSQKNLVEVLPVQNSLIVEETQNIPPGSPKKFEEAKNTSPKSPKTHKDSEKYYVTPESPDRKNGLKITISRIKSPPENAENVSETSDNQEFAPESSKKCKSRKKWPEESTIPEIFEKLRRRSSRRSLSPKKTGKSDGEENALTADGFSIVEQFKIAPEKFLSNTEVSEIIEKSEVDKNFESTEKTAPETDDTNKNMESVKSPEKVASARKTRDMKIASEKTFITKNLETLEKSPRKSRETSEKSKMESPVKTTSPRRSRETKRTPEKPEENTNNLELSEKSTSPKRTRVVLKLSPKKSSTCRTIHFPENNTPRTLTDSEKRDSICETETCNPYESIDVELTMKLDEPTKSPLNNSEMELCEKETESANFSETPEKDKNLPGSPITTETPTRNTELLLNTTDISPIKSPENKTLVVFEQLNETLTDTNEPSKEEKLKNSADQNVAPEKESLSPENLKDTPRNRNPSLRSAKLFSLIPGKSPLNIKPIVSSPKASRKSSASPKTNRVKKIMAKLEKNNAENENGPDQGEYEIISVSPKKSTASPKTLRVRRMMAKLDKKYEKIEDCAVNEAEKDKNYANRDKNGEDNCLGNAGQDFLENCKDSGGDLEQINPEDVLIFEREVPSPFATSAGGSILKRKKPDCPDEITPNAKRKRVNFSDPLTTSRKLFFVDSNIVKKNLKTDTDTIESHVQPPENAILKTVIESLEDQINQLENDSCKTVEKSDVDANERVQVVENKAENVTLTEESNNKENVQKTEDKTIVIEDELSSDNINETVIDLDSCNAEKRQKQASESVKNDKVLNNIANESAETSDSTKPEQESETERRKKALELFKDAVGIISSLDTSVDENLEVLGFAFDQLASITPKMYWAKKMYDMTVAKCINN